MAGRTPQFGTRITRRVVALFVLCALLPVAATLMLTYERVQSALVAQRVALLRGAASGYAVSIVERLNIAESLGAHVAAEIGARRPPKGAAYEGYFRAAAALTPGAAEAVFGRGAAALERELPGGRRLVVAHAERGEAGVWLVVHAPAGPPIALEIDPGFLWRDDALPFGTDICVLDASGTPLHCSRPLPEAALLSVRQSLAAQARGDTEWSEGPARYLASYNEIFLRGRYGAPSWTVVAAQPAESALAPMEGVQRAVLPVIALGVLVAALLGMVQVRRTLGPLRDLSDATARIAVRDFSVHLDVTRDDEFGALAQAFNSMSARLNIQFKALLAHAELDAVILSTVDLPRIAAIVVKRSRELVASDRQYLLLADPAAQGSYRLYADSPEMQAGIPASVSPEDAMRLLASPTGLRFSLADEWLRLQGLSHLPGRSLFVLPIPLNGQLAGAIVLAYDDERRPGGGDVSILIKLADRVAVALATARRDRELRHRANYDALTQLPNRALGMEELQRAVSHAARHRRVLAVLFIDLDGFSDVNDSLGHEAGDQLLAETARRLRACVRETDILCRLGGDEFALVLPELPDPGDAAVVARHVITDLSQPFRLASGEASVTASVGIALYPADATTGEDLLRNADLAMYSAKQSGPGQAAYFQPSMNEEVRRRLELERELREALAQRQFELHYQPQIDLRTGRIRAAEALIRWRHPRRGLVRPADFIPLAEANGLIEPIGSWAMETACAQLVAWRAQGLALDHVSVNVSPRQLRKAGLDTQMAEALRRHDLVPAAVHLEITESALLGDQPAASANFSALVGLGMQLELDDFGTGYSSLARLQHVPVVAVKLDRSFISPVERNGGAQAVVRAAIEMSHALGKYVVAEGIEDRGQFELLSALGCDLGQGYYWSPPVPPEQFAAFLRLEPSSASGPLPAG